MPIFVWRCKPCNTEVEHLTRSRDEAEQQAEICTCGQLMELAVTSFAFTEFRPFVSTAFRDGTPTYVRDRSQLRALLKAEGLREAGDTGRHYFGSNPNSVPSWKEIAAQSKPAVNPKSSKLVRVVEASEMRKLDQFVERTDFGRRATDLRPEEKIAGSEPARKVLEAYNR